MKKDSNDKKKIGLLAQDIEKVFPELVTETNDIKSVNYQGLIPVLINAMKEQQSEIDELKEKESNYLQQEKRLEKLEQIISNMEK
jgi:Tfp pilus assembly protein PilN